MSSSTPANSPNSNNSSCSSNNNNNNRQRQARDIFLYEIPSLERQKLCSILDELNVWQELALGHMGYSKTDLMEIRRALQMGNSPSDELLTLWGEQNHTITELFVLLHRMKQFSAMDSIKSLVETKYQKLIPTTYHQQVINSSNEQPDWDKILQNSTDEKKLNYMPSGNNIKNHINSETISSSDNESSEVTTSSTNDNNQYGNLKSKDVNKYASTIPQINYWELTEATNSWNDKQILGKGGFGTVYHGIWKYTAVAIKRIEYQDRHGLSTELNKIQIQQSLNELKYLNSCRHDNILPLYGYSINGNEPCLVYQLMAGGSLAQRLDIKKCGNFGPLNWMQRLNIAQGTARGLQFLHTFREKPLIHGDIKPANILLDPCTQPKIGDFGLAREGPNALNSSMEVSRVYGTKPYLPVEFLGLKSLSTKVDTFSFGVVLLELATGLRAYDPNRQYKFLTKHILAKCADNITIENLMDKNLPCDLDGMKICHNLIALGRICIAEKADNRPEMVMVLENLMRK